MLQHKYLDTLSFATSGVWIRLLLSIKPYISQSCHDRAQDSLASGGDNQVVRENAGWSIRNFLHKKFLKWPN